MTLPDFLDTDNLRNIALLSVVALVVIAYFVTKIVTAIVMRTILLGVIVGLGALIWSQRAALGTCVDDARTAGDCECELIGFTVPLPDSVREICEQAPNFGSS